MRVLRWPALPGLAVLLAIGTVLPAASQDKPKQPAATAKQESAPAAASQLPVPPAEQLVLLIRLSLLTLHDAIQTGNYSVLRDRGGPAFRQANSASGLARIFTTLESQRPDLAVVAIRAPHLSEAMVIGPEQLLHVKGHFPGQPMQIDFELIYEPADGQWQLFGLSVGARPAQAQAVQDPVAAPPSKAAQPQKTPPAKK